VYIANIGTMGTAVTADVVLPRDTFFAIDATKPDRRVVCRLVNFHTNQSFALTGADCDQSPSRGFYGAQFAPSSKANPGQWRISPGQAIVFMFPIVSRSALNGFAARPADCMIASVFAVGSLGNGYDHPGPFDRCPLPDGRGASQGVFVSPA
jgi:hypothetical protein